MKLNILERFTLSDLLPATGSFANMKLVREAKESLSFTADEHEEYGIVEGPQGGVKWNPVPGAVIEKDFEFNDVIGVLLSAKLKELDKNEKLEDRHLSLYEKFIG